MEFWRNTGQIGSEKYKRHFFERDFELSIDLILCNFAKILANLA